MTLSVIAVIVTPISTLAAVWVTHWWETKRTHDQHAHEDAKLRAELDARERERVATARQAFRHEQVSALRLWLKSFYAGLNVSMLRASINAAPNPQLQLHIDAILAMPVADPRDKSIEIALSPISDERVAAAVRELNQWGRDLNAAIVPVEQWTRLNTIPWTQTQTSEFWRLMEPVTQLADGRDARIAKVNKMLEEYELGA